MLLLIKLIIKDLKEIDLLEGIFFTTIAMNVMIEIVVETVVYILRKKYRKIEQKTATSIMADKVKM
jgi:hypothetical protein